MRSRQTRVGAMRVQGATRKHAKSLEFSAIPVRMLPLCHETLWVGNVLALAQVNTGSTVFFRLSTLNSCLGGQRSCTAVEKQTEAFEIRMWDLAWREFEIRCSHPNEVISHKFGPLAQMRSSHTNEVLSHRRTRIGKQRSGTRLARSRRCAYTLNPKV